ncbi:hypothetical protein AMTR_s00004p00270730 [Amborella trichopoda]|uniref:Uncharacterized protein n=1 Tax=Amborella trichopoda TaxID=13333 RepID=W1NDM7_AMBTC|nr:hypothetical protein AMTR_s00004p00270730 [Amborella trichopoda]
MEKEKGVERKECRGGKEGYESPIDEDDDQEAKFEAQMKRVKIASLQELNYRQMKIQELYGRIDDASSRRQPQQPVVPSRGGYFYLQMISSITEAGPGVRSPTVKELAGGPCLEPSVYDVDRHIAQFKVLARYRSDHHDRWLEGQVLHASCQIFNRLP